VPGTPPAALAVVYVSTELTDEEISAVLQSSATSISSQSG
jgi:hypothetical protein